MEIRLKDIIIRCDHPDASEEAAQLIAGVFNKYCLEGHPENEPLVVVMTMGDGTDIVYEVLQSLRS